jgi:hypothetical protein
LVGFAAAMLAGGAVLALFIDLFVLGSFPVDDVCAS